MQELKAEQLQEINGAGTNEAACVAGFSASGTLGGFIIGGIATAGIGMGPGLLGE